MASEGQHKFLIMVAILSLTISVLTLCVLVYRDFQNTNMILQELHRHHHDHQHELLEIKTEISKDDD